MYSSDYRCEYYHDYSNQLNVLHKTCAFPGKLNIFVPSAQLYSKKKKNPSLGELNIFYAVCFRQTTNALLGKLIWLYKAWELQVWLKKKKKKKNSIKDTFRASV